MANTNRMSLALVLVISCVYYANGDLLDLPQNVAVLEGTTVTLTCTANPSGPMPRVAWIEYSTNDEGMILSDNKFINPTHVNAARYNITGDSPFDFNLEIKDLILADGGRYACEDISAGAQQPIRGSAELILLNDDPVCYDISTITGVIVEERFYWNECDLKYRGNLIPTMTWTGPGTYNNDHSLTESEIWSRISFLADREVEGGRFECVTNFQRPGGLPPDSATNTPSYEYTFQGSVLIVNWGPKNMEIAPLQPAYDIGDVLTCTADAKPDPAFQWTNIRTQQDAPPGPTFTVTADMFQTEQLMRCNAQSTIEGILYTFDVFANVSVPGPTTPTTPGTTTPTTPAPADSPCFDVTGQWTSTNPNANLCLEVDSKGNVLSLLRNGTDTFFVTGSGKTVYNDYKHIGITGIWPSGSAFGVGGFVGECHRCFGNEIILVSGLARNKESSPACGVSAGTRLSNVYAFTRFGPPCRNPPGKVLRPSETHIKHFGIQTENILL